MIRRIPRHIVFCPSLFGHRWKLSFQSQSYVNILLILFCLVFQSHVVRAQQPPNIDAVPTTIAPAPAAASPATPPPSAAKKPDDKSTDQKIVNNPFVPGGVMTADQIVTRKEITALMADQENRLRRDLAGQTMSPDELAKLVGNAAAPVAISKPDNFMGCVNGIPLYRENDGTLDLGTKDPEPIRQERCGNK